MRPNFTGSRPTVEDLVASKGNTLTLSIASATWAMSSSAANASS